MQPGAVGSRRYTPEMFALQGIEHRYDGRIALAVASWQASRGERWLLAGPSGSGKSTLLGVLAGLLRPTAGKVTVGDQLRLLAHLYARCTLPSDYRDQLSN